MKIGLWNKLCLWLIMAISGIMAFNASLKDDVLSARMERLALVLVMVLAFCYFMSWVQRKRNARRY